MTGSWLEILSAGAAGMGTPLDADHLSRLALFVAELKRWNKRINLTAITSDREIAVKHLLDSLTLTTILPQTGRLLDIGTGGGIPGVPLSLPTAIAGESPRQLSCAMGSGTSRRFTTAAMTPWS